MLKLRPEKLTLLLGLIAFGLLSLDCAVLLAKGLGYEQLRGVVSLFEFGGEMNLPTFFSTLLAIMATGLLLVITMARKQMQRPWKLWAGLAGVFLLVAMDDFIGMHEQLSRPVRDLLDARGMLYFAWIIPYGVLVMLLAGIYGRFVFEMPAHLRNGLLLSATLFLIGALGFEMLAGQLAESRLLEDPLVHGGLTTTQESLEIAGMILFIHTLMRYIEDVQKNILFQLGAYDPLAHIISEAQKPLPASVFRRLDNSDRAERS